MRAHHTRYSRPWYRRPSARKRRIIYHTYPFTTWTGLFSSAAMAFILQPLFARRPRPPPTCTRRQLPTASAAGSTNSQLEAPSEPPTEASPTKVCEHCAGQNTVPCTLCNAFGFIRVDENTDWKTCNVCQGLGKILCDKCQPPDAPIPLDF